MNTVQLKYFTVVAEHMSFTRAAEHMYVSQPAVSKQIAMLENELGVKLFERSRAAGLRLTPEGERYLKLFRGFLAGLEKTAAEIEAARSERRVLRIGIPEGWELPSGVRALFEEGGFDLSWQAHSFNELTELLVKGELDMAASISMEQLKRNPWVRTLPFVTLRGIFLFSAGHRRAGEHFEISDLMGERMYLLENPEGPRVDNTRLIGPLGFDPPAVFMPNRDSILLAIESGEGFAFFDEWVRYSSYPGFAFVHSGTESPTYLYWRKDAGANVERLAHEVSAAAQLLQK